MTARSFGTTHPTVDITLIGTAGGMSVHLRQDAAMVDPGHVTVSLTSDEALVLFDLLHGWEDDDQVSAPRHRAEQVALWAVGRVGASDAGALRR